MEFETTIVSEDEQHEELVEVLDEELINTDADTICTICQAEFLDPDDLMRHLHQIHKIIDLRSLICVVCFQKCTDLMNFAEHFRDEHMRDLFYCQHCLRGFSDEDEYLLHTKKHKRSYKTAYCCTQCNRNFWSTTELKNHDFKSHFNNADGVLMQPYLPYLSAIFCCKAETVLFSVRKDAVYNCCSCNYSTPDIKAFIRHNKSKKCKVVVCEACSSIFIKKSKLVYHLKKRCGKEKDKLQKECPDCKQFFSKLVFKQHKKVCNVIKCYTCGTSYDSMYELTEHQSQEHPKQVELKTCTFCWKQFVGTVALQKHMDRTHKWDLHLYKYMCVYCKTPYKHPQKLFAHFFTNHKDKEPYTCKICPKNFRIRKKFTVHIKLEHKSIGFVEFDENYNVFFTDKKSENPFIPKPLFQDTNKDAVVDKEDSNINLLSLNSEISVTETEGNQTEVESAPKKILKRKRGPKSAKKKLEEETITVESSDEESLLVVKKRVQKQQKLDIDTEKRTQPTVRWKKRQSDLNKKQFTCNICNKYCYTYQNFNHHVSLHSKKDYKKCIKCSKVFRSKEKLQNHVRIEHSSSKLTDTLKNMLEKRKKGEKYSDNIPNSEKFRLTIKKVQCDQPLSYAKIEKVDNGLSVQKFIENFTPEAETEIDKTVTCKIWTGRQREPLIKMEKFEERSAPVSTKLSMPVKFKTGHYVKAIASIRVVQPVSVVVDEDTLSDTPQYEDDLDRNESIPEVAEEIMLEGTEETPKAAKIPHKIVLPKLPTQYKDLRIAHLQPEAPYYKIVKVKDVLNSPKETKEVVEDIQCDTIKLPDGTKLVNTNPLAHLLGKTSIEKVVQPMKNKYYKSKMKNFQGMLAEALCNLDRPKKKKEKVGYANSEVSSHIED